jgi:hypothetical protein
MYHNWHDRNKKDDTMTKLIKFPESEISKEIEKNGLKVKVEVCRGDNDDWILEIVDEQWNSTVWDEVFSNAEEALKAGISAIEKEGIKAFIGDSEK